MAMIELISAPFNAELNTCISSSLPSRFQESIAFCPPKFRGNVLSTEPTTLDISIATLLPVIV